MTVSTSLRTGLVALIALLMTPFVASAADCDFSRTLFVGEEGEDVRCLQEYLNASGFTVATTGVGSPGSETTIYGSLTEAAVLRWQEANGVVGANGNFGPASQSLYTRLASTQVASVTTGTDPLDDIVASLQAQLEMADASAVAVPVPQVAGVSDTATSEIEADAIDVLVELVEQVQEIDEELDADTAFDLYSNLTDLRFNLYNSLLKFFAREYETSASIAEAVLDDAEDMLDDIDSLSDEDEAEEALEDARDWYNDLRDEQDEAEEDGDDVSDLDDYLDEADDYLDEAEDAMDEGDYDDVLDLIGDAEDALEDAEDEL